MTDDVSATPPPFLPPAQTSFRVSLADLYQQVSSTGGVPALAMATAVTGVVRDHRVELLEAMRADLSAMSLADAANDPKMLAARVGAVKAYSSILGALHTEAAQQAALHLRQQANEDTKTAMLDVTAILRAMNQEIRNSAPATPPDEVLAAAEAALANDPSMRIPDTELRMDATDLSP